MWIDEGIDTGNLILTEKTKFNGNETFFDVHLKVMEHAHDLYIKAIQEIKDGESKSISQNEVQEGVTFYNKDWDIKAHRNLAKNLKKLTQLLKSES